jgi:NADP-dependent aldehyde dehydrogenase
VCVFGPNNFPFAFNGASGGDFAAAIAAGNPVIAKANSAHPGVTRLLAEEALAASQQAGMPAGSVQLLYRLDHADGERLVAHPLVGATGYTGSRSAGLTLKRAADAAGKPIYLELSSVNPVVFLPGVVAERGEALAGELQGSCLMGTGQFCTSPGLILLLAGAETEKFIATLAEGMKKAPVGTLLSGAVERSLGESIRTLQAAGAELLAGGSSGGGTGYSCANTVLRTSGKRFLEASEALQTEAFGNCTLLVVAQNAGELIGVLEQLEGNLTGTIYSAAAGDEELYRQVEPVLRRKVGRLLNDKMPTGVAVSPAMNHGGPFPATGHPGFTAVGLPAAVHRFAALHCYDNVRDNRLPAVLRNANIAERPFRFIDGVWTTANVGE